MANLTSHAARGGAITIASQLARLALTLLSTAVLARLLEPGAFGLIAMVLTVVGFGELIRDFGFSHAALRKKNLTAAQQSNLFWLNTAIGAVCSALVLAASPLIAGFFRQPELLPITAATSSIFLLNGLATQFRVRLNRQLRFSALAICDLVPIATALCVAATGALVGFGVWALVAQQLVIAAGGLVLAAVLARWIPGPPSRRTDMDDLLRSGWHLTVTQLLAYWPKNVDSIAIGRVWGSTGLGLYDRAYQLMIVPLNQIGAPLTRVALPLLAQVKDDTARFTAALRKAHLIGAYLSSLIYIMAIALGPSVVALLLGPAWPSAAILLQILAVGGLFRSLVQVTYWMYVSLGHTRAQLRFYLVSQPLLVAGILAGLPWGPIGVAVAHSVSFTVYWAIALLWAGHVSKISTRGFFQDAVRAILLVSAPAGVLAALVASLLPGAILQLVVGMIAAGCWVTIVGIFVPRVRRDFATLISFAKSAVRRKAAHDESD
ncbi:lipopolysaccharide biosynthesis protein [Plantibacter sp. CFBP 8804]|uniref:lipopolysaccharide biosynthesis protein n=1 Tax=Plantibacter sp. CFBP 8804 TaxID=2775270 RepID=UPI00177F59D1|nr:lipopolysaccharide biosynthesis protein [Plantibacter sp. CFBP 8804]MBD8518354.1 lipopolysaccharide biosynthesis protein [Plantibacter sp. CFBP 8804]